jgi:hypothetical protein
MDILAYPEVIDGISAAIKSTSFPLLFSLHLASAMDTSIVRFQPAAPNLRELYLESSTLNFDICANLTHLYIENDRGVEVVKDLLPLLERSPRLQMLALQDVYANDEEFLATAPKVQLVHIQRLHLWTIDQPFVDYFLAHLFIPSRPSLLDNHSWTDSAITFDDVVPSLPPLQTGNDGTLEIDYPHGSMRLHGGARHRPCDITAVPLSPLISLASTFLDLIEVQLLILKDFGQDNDAAGDIWIDLLSSMPSLRSISVHGPHGILKNLFLALWPDFSLNSSPSRPHVCLHLTHVHIDFERPRVDNEASGQFILSRLEAGERVGRPPLEMLEIRSAIPLSEQEVVKLTSLVKVLTAIPWPS